MGLIVTFRWMSGNIYGRIVIYAAVDKISDYMNEQIKVDVIVTSMNFKAFHRMYLTNQQRQHVDVYK